MTANAPLMPKMKAFQTFLSSPPPPAPRTASGQPYYPVFMYDVFEEVWYWDTQTLQWVIYYLPVNPVYCLETFVAPDGTLSSPNAEALADLFPMYTHTIGFDYPLAYPSNKLVPFIQYGSGSLLTDWINAGVEGNTFARGYDYQYAWDVVFADITARLG